MNNLSPNPKTNCHILNVAKTILRTILSSYDAHITAWYCFIFASKRVGEPLHPPPSLLLNIACACCGWWVELVVQSRFITNNKHRWVSFIFKRGGTPLIVHLTALTLQLQEQSRTHCRTPVTQKQMHQQETPCVHEHITLFTRELHLHLSPENILKLISTDFSSALNLTSQRCIL